MYDYDDWTEYLSKMLNVSDKFNNLTLRQPLVYCSTWLHQRMLHMDVIHIWLPLIPKRETLSYVPSFLSKKCAPASMKAFQDDCTPPQLL